MRRALFLSLLLAACSPSLVAQSVPPPGRTGQLEGVDNFWGITDHYELELSSGTVLAVSCDRGGPCRELRFRAVDPSVADVVPAALAQLQPANGYADTRPAASFLVVGKRAGTTDIFVAAREGRRRIAVKVVPAPAPVAAKVVAR